MMKFLLFLMVVCYGVCDDTSNYYVVEIPDDSPQAKPFKVYWNVPTMQCRSKKVPFNNLYEKFGIIQNEGDNFRGEKITILYEPGLFPAIFKNESSGKYRFRNGGVPQEGDLQEHLRVFRQDMNEIIPDPNFDGIGIIDFESWRPMFRQNFGTLVPYKDVSIEVEKKLHPWWPAAWVQSEAKRRFEEFARIFMQTTLSIAKQMRPKARWGYYGFPHCFNMAPSNLVEGCSKDVIKENDQTYWLWSESTALLPSLYRAKDLSPSQLAKLVRGRVSEAARVMRGNTAILPYFWFRYRDSGYVVENDLMAIFNELYKSDANGFVIWGSSNDVNSFEKCTKLLNYVDKVLGPAIAKFTRKYNKQEDEMIDTTTSENVDTTQFQYTTSNVTTSTQKVNVETTTNTLIRVHKIDPEITFIPPINYTEDISQNVDKLMKKENKLDETKLNNGSIILSVLLDSIISKQEFDPNNETRPVRSDNDMDKVVNYLVNMLKYEPQYTDISTEGPLKDSIEFINEDNDQIYSKEDSTERNILKKTTLPPIIPNSDEKSFPNFEELKENEETLDSEEDNMDNITNIDISEETYLVEKYIIDNIESNNGYIVLSENNFSDDQNTKSTSSDLTTGTINDRTTENTNHGTTETTSYKTTDTLNYISTTTDGRTTKTTDQRTTETDQKTTETTDQKTTVHSISDTTDYRTTTDEDVWMNSEEFEYVSNEFSSTSHPEQVVTYV